MSDADSGPTVADDREYPDPDGEVPSLSAVDLYGRIEAGEPVSVLDVRDRPEFEAWRVEGPSVTARQTPYNRFLAAEVTGGAADLLPADLEEPVVVVCARGAASAYVAGVLRDAGVEAFNLADGMAGWARLLVAREVDGDSGDPTTGAAAERTGGDVVPAERTGGDPAAGAPTAGLRVVQYHRPSSGCLSYLVHDGSRAALVDPLRSFADRYVADCEALGLSLRYAVDTHVHADHVSGVREVAARTGAEAVLPAGAVDRGLADPERFRLVGDGDRLPVGEGGNPGSDDGTGDADGGTGPLALEAVALPGHTTEMTGFRVPGGAGPDPDREPPAGSPDLLVGGDSLFLDAVARPDLERADEGGVRELADRLYDTLTDRIGAMDADTVLAPGHRGPATRPAADGTYTDALGAVRDRVAALDRDRAAFVDGLVAGTSPRPANFRAVIEANLGRTTLDEERAFELELGPNNCAAGG